MYDPDRSILVRYATSLRDLHEQVVERKDHQLTIARSSLQPKDDRITHLENRVEELQTAQEQLEATLAHRNDELAEAWVRTDTRCECSS